jgi:hypothetical protein
LPSASFGLIYMPEGLIRIHLWRHCPFKSQFKNPKTYYPK